MRHTPVLDKEFIKNLDLPGLSVDDIETVLSENRDWSGEQIDQFLRSAVDLSEIESKLFSLTGYESDSGYSTYDVSPVTSNAPANLSYSIGQVSNLPSCSPPPLMLINHSTSPLFGNPTFAGLPLHPHPSPSMLIHDTAVSPCTSDGGFFSPHSSFGSVASTPGQESIPFFPPATMYSQLYSQPHDFGNGIFFPDLSAPAPAAIPNFSLQIPEIILHDVNSSQLPCSVQALPPQLHPSDVKQSASHLPPSLLSNKYHKASLVTTSSQASEAKEADSLVKSEGCASMACTVEKTNLGLSGSDSGCAPVYVSQVPDVKPNALPKAHCTQNVTSGAAEGQHYPIITQYRHSSGGSGPVRSLPMAKKCKSGITKTGKVAMKQSQKKKTATQWPRSMNRANLVAFREHILNKLKKAQEMGATESTTAQAIPIQVLANKSPTTASKTTGITPATTSPSPPLTKFKASSPKSAFELQVTYEKNHHLTPPKRCHSEPADLRQSVMAGSTACLHDSRSDSNLNKVKPTSFNAHCTEELKLFGTGTGNCGDILSEFNFNPDTFLSPNLDEKMLDDLEFKFSMEDDENGEILDLFGVSDKHVHCPSTSSLSDVDSMDIDCIHNFLDDPKPPQTFSCSSSPSPLGSPSPQGGCGDGQSSTVSSSTYCSFSRSNSICSVDANAHSQPQYESSCDSPPSSKNEVDTSFKFPEILSIRGSMVLDGVSLSDDGEVCAANEYQPQHAFLQSHYDPLLADGHSTASVELFDF